jgi:hypothetical protein
MFDGFSGDYEENGEDRKVSCFADIVCEFVDRCKMRMFANAAQRCINW